MHLLGGLAAYAMFALEKREPCLDWGEPSLHEGCKSPFCITIEAALIAYDLGRVCASANLAGMIFS